jgi:uncharacterized membrane protein
VAARVAIALLVLATLAFGLFGISRSLWLDEAWVANSVHAPTLGEMFYYPGWLQTSPPLFLLLERAVVSVFGISNAAVRAVPLALELAAVGLFFAAARRLVSLPMAVLAAALVAFHPVAIEYSRTAKQYSGELAATAALLVAATMYFERPSRRTFAWLALAVLVAAPLSYSAVFLIPGVVCAVAVLGGRRRAAWLVLAAGAMLAILYLLFIRPNYSPMLREFWSADPERARPFGFMPAVAVCLGAILWFRRRTPLVWICASPILLLAASAALGWYPASPRTSLFELPCVVLLLAMVAQEFLSRWPRLAPVVWIAAAAIPLVAGWRQVREHRNQPEEDFAGAVQFLRQHAQPSDRLLVHPSVKEGFELYAGMQGFTAPRPVYGATGWPCCVRGHLAPPHSPSRQAVIDDLAAKIPPGFSGRVWLIYSSRPTQWDYTGLDEGNLWRSQAWTMGCPPEEFVAFTNVAISPMYCKAPPEPTEPRR